MNERRKRQGLVALALLCLILVVLFAVLSGDPEVRIGEEGPDRKSAEVADPGVVDADPRKKTDGAIDLLDGPNPFGDSAGEERADRGDLLVEVRREDGKRLLGAVVHAVGTKRKTNEDGQALFADIEPAAKYGIRAYGTDFYDVPGNGWIGVSPGCRSEVRIIIRRGAAVRGRLVTPDGRPVGVESVVGIYRNAFGIRRTPVEAGALAFGTFGPGGRFELAGVPAGTVYVRAGAEWHAAGGSRPIEMLPGKTVEGVTVVLRPAGRIEGRVVRRGTTTPVKGVALGVVGPGIGHAKSGEDGSFRIGGLPPGTYRLMGTLRGFANANVCGVEVVAGKETSNLLLSMGPGGDITGTLHGLEDDDGRAVRLSAVRVIPGVPLEECPDIYVPRSFAGEFDMGPVEPGVYVIRAIDSRNRIIAEAQARVDEGTRTRVDLRAGTALKETGGKVSGVVVDSRGRPAPDARVWLIPQGDTATRGFGFGVFGNTAANGTFTLEGARAGRYVVGASGAGGAGSSAAVAVRDGQATEGVRISLTPTVLVKFRAQHGSGNPAVGLYLSLHRKPDHRVTLYIGTWGPTAITILPGVWDVYLGRLRGPADKPVDTIEITEEGDQAFVITID